LCRTVIVWITAVKIIDIKIRNSLALSERSSLFDGKGIKSIFEPIHVTGLPYLFRGPRTSGHGRTYQVVFDGNARVGVYFSDKGGYFVGVVYRVVRSNPATEAGG
jgi:hypothetical protein